MEGYVSIHTMEMNGTRFMFVCVCDQTAPCGQCHTGCFTSQTMPWYPFDETGSLLEPCSQENHLLEQLYIDEQSLRGYSTQAGTDLTVTLTQARNS